MIYVVSSKRKISPPVLIIASVILLGSVVFVWKASVFFSAVRHITAATAIPFWNTKYVVSQKIKNYRSVFSSKQALNTENENLKKKIAFYEARLSFLPVLEQENRELKELLGYRASGTVSSLAAVLSHPGSSPYDTIFIDAGSFDGVKSGDFVGAYGVGILGVVEHVYSKDARVRLFSSPGMKLEVFIGEDKTPAYAEGTGGGNFRTQLPRGVPVREGDMVFLADNPRKIVGTVTVIRAGASDSFQTILFQSPVNIYTLRWVELFHSREE